MKDFQIGVMLDSFRLPVRDAIEKARALGAEGVQIYATKGEMAPENLTPTDRRELLRRIQDAGMQVSALCGGSSTWPATWRPTSSRPTSASCRRT